MAKLIVTLNNTVNSASYPRISYLRNKGFTDGCAFEGRGLRLSMFTLPESNLSLQEYVDLLMGLTIEQVIIYYFTVSIIISLFQALGKMELDTDNKLRTNPKVLLSLSILYILRMLYSIYSRVFNLDDLSVLSLTIVTLAVALFCVRYLLVIKFFELVHRIKLFFVKKKLQKEKSDGFKLNFSSEEFKKRKGQLKSTPLFRTEHETLTIYAIVLAILIPNIYQMNWVFGITLGISGLIIIWNKLHQTKKLIKSYDTNNLKYFYNSTH